MPGPSGYDKDSGSKVHVIMPGNVFHAAALPVNLERLVRYADTD